MASDDPRDRSLVGLSETVRSDDGAPAPAPTHPFAIDDDRRYREIEVVGAGGLGTVLLARDQRLDRDVALKRIAERGDEDEAGARFLREARITARLDHPGIVPIHDAGRSADGRLYYTMRLIRGRELVGAEAAPPTVEARLGNLGAFIAACHAVGYAHRHGIVHRDLKPANIMIGEYGEAQVVDWGLAESLDEAIAADAPPVGTLPYLAPEAAAGGPGTIAADVWALGAIGYELVTGARRRPGDRLAVMAGLAAGELPPPAWPDEAPVELRAILERALAIEPAGRYPDAEALAEDLEAFRDGRRVAAHRYSPWQLARRFVIAWRWPLALAGAALVTGVAALALTAHRTERQRARAVAAERATRAELVRAETALGRSLAARAVAAYDAGRHADAELLATAALARVEDPDARGVIAAVVAAPHPVRAEPIAIPGCPWVIPGAALDALCLGPDALERWTLSPLARTWRVDGVFDGAVAGATMVIAWDARAQTQIELATGAVQRFADPDRRDSLELERPVAVVTGPEGAIVAAHDGMAALVHFGTEAFASLRQPCGALGIDAIALSAHDLYLACGDGWLRRLAVGVEDGQVGAVDDVGPLGLDGRTGRATAMAIDEQGFELAIGAITGAVVRRDLRGCFSPDCGAPRDQLLPARGDGGIRALVVPGGVATIVVNHGGDAVELGAEPPWPRGRWPVAPGAALAVVEGGVAVGGRVLTQFAGTAGGRGGVTAPLAPSALATGPGELLAIGGDRAIAILRGGARVGEARVRGQVVSLAWSADGARLAAALDGDPDAGVRLFTVDDERVREVPLAGAPGFAAVVAFAADGSLMAQSSGGQSWWSAAGEPTRGDAPIEPTFDRDGRWACDREGRRWQRTDRRWHERGRCAGALLVAADRAGRYLALAARQQVSIEALGGGALRTVSVAPAELTAVALSDDGRWLALGTATGAVELRRPDDGAVVARLVGHRHRVTGLWFDGDALVSGGEDGTVRWHALAPLTAEPGALATAATARWGRTVDDAIADLPR